MPDLALYLFGAPRLEHDGVVLPLGRRKSMALLSYLAVTRSRYHRETLAALLWPESGADAAYSALRNVLWILRQTPVARILRSDRSTVDVLEEKGLWVDVNAFRDLAGSCPGRTHSLSAVCERCLPLLEQAVALVEGPFMDGFSASNSPGFDDWQLSEGVALRRELRETLERLVSHYSDREDWSQAVVHARRWVHVDPLDESGHRQLMTALMAQGKRTEALSCFEACARALHAELDLRPDEATVALADRIRTSNGERQPGTIRRTPTNLHTGLLPLIGRKGELAHLRDLVLRRESRLVTLVGLGGSGKTHLALHLGRELLDEFADGVFSVSLDALNGDRYAASEIARALGVALLRGEPTSLPLELADYLQGRQLLLILDGAEALSSQGDLLTDMLRAAEGVSLLVTSRQPLEIRGETVVSIDGLSVPADETPTESLSDCDSIRLLRTAAKRIGGGKDVAAEEGDAAAMAQIARLVDGLPLGLEIAAGWSRILPWQEIARRMSEEVDLPHRQRDVPERHRSLAAIYEQTWQSLSMEEQQTLRRLAVFRDGFGIDAAEAVAGSSPVSLAGLANRCMIRRIEAGRYEIHELLRQFSLQRLEQNPAEHAAARTAHAEYFASQIEMLFERLKGREQVAALRLIRRDIANIRIAWCRAAEEGRLDLLERTAEAMFFYYDVSAFFEEGQQAFEDALSILKDAPKPSAILGFVKTCYGWFVQHACFGESRDWIRDGLDVVDAAAPFGSLHAYAHVIAAYAGVFADPEEGARRLEQSLAFYRQANDRWGESLALTAVAEYAVRDDPKRGEEYALESLRLSQQFEDLWGQALTLNALARFAERRGDLGLAKVRYHQSQRLAELIAPDLFTVVDTLISRARVGCRLGDQDEADELAEEALQLARQAGNSLLIARALRRRGRQACDRGEFAAAKRDLLESLSLLQARSRTEEAALCAIALGDTEKASGDRTSASGWYQEAASLDADCAEAAERLRSVAEESG